MPSRCPEQDDRRRRQPQCPYGHRDVAAAWLLLMIVAGLAGLMVLLLFDQ